MRNIILLLIVFLSQLTPIHGIDLEARFGCLIPQESKFRHVYRKVILDFELEASNPLEEFLNCNSALLAWSDISNWSSWGNLSYYSQNGHFTYLHNHTKVSNLSLNIGLKKYFGYCGDLRPYLGVGIGTFYACFKEDSIFVRQYINQWGFAFLVKSGVECEITPCLFLDLYADYAYCEFDKPHAKHGITTNSSNIGGLKVGVGLGWRW